MVNCTVDKISVINIECYSVDAVNLIMNVLRKFFEIFCNKSIRILINNSQGFFQICLPYSKITL